MGSPSTAPQSQPQQPQRSLHRTRRSPWTAALTILVVLACHATAATTNSHPPEETLIIDQRVNYQQNDGSWVMVPKDEADLRRVRKRDHDETEEATPTTTLQIAVSTATETTSATTLATSITPPSPLPSPLDSNLSSNFSKAADNSTPCPLFINSFLTDPIFKQCYPLSLLLQGSKSFFEAERSLVSTTQVLDATCAANATFCSRFLTDLATRLVAEENCGMDYRAGHPVVRNAYLAMVGYAPLYTAGCLIDPQTSMYCYANAITNMSSPSNVYFYYLPLNITLPGSTVPSCSPCLQQTMNVFQASTANRRQPIANTYVSAAQQVNSICGPTFVNETLVAELRQSAAWRTRQYPSWTVLGAAAVALMPWFL
ncbi:hypothetical protein B0T18DRAFT_335191 [Schizothecium vesticola]|uniref:DUF7729 domain-containing protein n=1 Tax=Schizothecium vesticola TaxID=314040 RepID=A0AA40EFR3_9PEZI|nr:hypothetical protein B0T18DRAFT_335191 [Schizothecium vesticola]